MADDVMTPQTSPENADPTDQAIGDDANPTTTIEDYVPGEYTSFDVSDAPFAEFSEDAKNILRELVILAARTDVASRRFEVEQCWEARLFERGYQHLLPRKGGGWSLPGEGSKWGPLATADSSALYSTNIYGRDRDIIVAALAREVPETVFFPQDANNVADVQAAEAANQYKNIYEKNNNLRERLSEIAQYFYTDDRVILYTRGVADAQKFGRDENGQPSIQEITSVHGKLEGKVPTAVQYQSEMHFAQLYNEIDVSIAKCRYPWVAREIRPGSCGIGEIELDKIARVNTKLALLGSYVTGDAMMRDVTEQYTWVRPSMYFDECVPEDIRQEFLEQCPDGMLIVYAGQTLCFARNESMDNKLVVTHALPGIGQNRRALGTNNISVQKRLNAYLDLMDAFHRRTIPRRIYDMDAFDINALQAQDNEPGNSTPVLRQPGVPLNELMALEPTPQPQPSLPEFCQWYFEALPQSLVGTVPSLFGAPTNTDTVGGIQTQRDQALERQGTPWNNAKVAINQACKHAVMAAAARPSIIKASLPESTIQIDPNVLKGSIVIYAEYDQSFPESWRERELRITEIAAQAPQNPFYAALLSVPANMRLIADNLRMADLHIPGEDSVKKQLIELDLLKTSAPIPNPTFMQAQDQLARIQTGMAFHRLSGLPMPDGAEQMFTQAQQLVGNMPQELPSIEPAPDESENHGVEGQTCFDWMNSEEGIKFKNGTPEQRAGYQNVYLHWQTHMELKKKFAPQPDAPAPHVSIPFDKLDPNAQSQALARAGLKSSPDALAQKKTTDTQHEIAKRVVPKTIPESINIHKITRGKANAQQPPTGSPAGTPRA